MSKPSKETCSADEVSCETAGSMMLVLLSTEEAALDVHEAIQLLKAFEQFKRDGKIWQQHLLVRQSVPATPDSTYNCFSCSGEPNQRLLVHGHYVRSSNISTGSVPVAVVGMAEACNVD